MFQDVKGNQCTVTDDGAIAALYKLMPQTLYDNLQMQVEEYDDWRDLFDRLQSYASSTVSINITDRPVQVGGGRNNGPQAMDIGSYSRKDSVTCWECGKTGHYGRDCWNRGKGQGKGNGKMQEGPKSEGKGSPHLFNGKGKGKQYASKGDAGGKSKGKGKGFDKGNFGGKGMFGKGKGKQYASKGDAGGKGKGKRQGF